MSDDVTSVAVPPHNDGLSAGVYVLSLGDGSRAVLKCLTSRPHRDAGPWKEHWRTGCDERSHWNFWRRESLCYESGLVDAFAAGGIRSPQLVASVSDEEDALLLLRFVDGVPGEKWSLSGYAEAARRLALGQAEYLCGRPYPNHDWLSQNFLHDYSVEKPVAWDLLESAYCWHHEMASSLPEDLCERARYLHAHSDQLYAINRRLPSTLCHLDFWPKNLVATEDGLVLLDWAFVGRGAVGEDAGNLIPDAVFDHFVPASQLGQLEQVVVEGYIAGLREAGWEGDRRLAELGIYSSCVKYDWLTPFTLAQLDNDTYRAYGNGGEVDARFRLRERGTVLAHLGTWAERALALADELNVDRLHGPEEWL